MAACIPTLRPLFRYFDGSKPGIPDRYRRGFLKQSDTSPSLAFHPRNDLEASTGHSLEILGPSYSDSRSGRCAHSVTDPNNITKTTEFSIIAEDRH